MSVLNILLWAVGVPLGIALMAIPFLSMVKMELKVSDAWRNIPAEIYASHRQQLLGIRPIYFWVVSGVLFQINDHLKWKGVDDAGLAILFVVLIYQVFWAMRIIRSSAQMDARLVRFARFAFWGSAVGFLLVAACLVQNFSRK